MIPRKDIRDDSLNRSQGRVCEFTLGYRSSAMLFHAHEGTAFFAARNSEINVGDPSPAISQAAGSRRGCSERR